MDPVLTISYTLVNNDTAKNRKALHAMVASDGPHYGANIKMMGVGNYKVTYTLNRRQSRDASPY
ncbi:iron transporter [Escherichia coli]